MATVTPKLYFSEKQGCQIPVWEIVTEKGGKIYYERIHHDGYEPIGILNSVDIGGSKVNMLGVVKPDGKSPVVVLKEKDGFTAPMTWYQRIEQSAD